MFKLYHLLTFLFLTASLQAQQVTTFAGSGIPGATDGPGLNAQFNQPYAIAIDSFGNLLVAEPFNHKIRKIDPAANVNTLAGSGLQGFQDGPAASARFNLPWGVMVGNNGEVVVGDNVNERLRLIDNNTVTTIAGSGVMGNQLGPALSAQFNKPYGVCSDDTGNIYFVDRYNQQIKKLTTGGNIVLIAGTGSTGFANGPGATASFDDPQDITIDALGNLYVSDRDNHAIRKITPAGIVSTLAGTGVAGYQNGLGNQAQFNIPVGIFADPCGNIYIADHFNHRIRKIDPSGNVTTVAGSGTPGYIDGPAGTARFNKPWDVVKDRYGNLFVTDNANNRIRKVSNPNDSTHTKSGCIGDLVTLQIQPADSIIWMPGTGLSCNNCDNPTTTVTGPAQYVAISYQDCEIRIDTFNILPASSSLSGSDTTILTCAGFQVALQASIGDSVSWSPSGGLSCSSCFNPTGTFTQSTQVIATVFSACAITKDTFNISIIPGSTSGSFQDSTFCLGSSIELTASPGDSVGWSPLSGISCSSCFTTTVSPLQSTQYVATVYNNCDVILDTFDLTVLNSNADAGNNVTISFNGSTTLNATGTGTYSWSPSSSLSCPDCPNPVASPASTTTYYLTVEDSNGCISKDSVTVFVEKDCSALILPNAFSPNDDGLNDIFLPLGDLEQFQNIRIYNRWGEFIFESSNAADGWDGTFKREPQPAGVYAYILQYSCKNESFMKSGNITLIR